MGLPLDIFGKEAFFQPYLPLQEVDQLAAPSWLVGTTNQIVTQQRTGHWDLLVDVCTSGDLADVDITKHVRVRRSALRTGNGAYTTRPQMDG
jgi:hypothetical protein